MGIGERIAEERKRLGYSQSALAIPGSGQQKSAFRFTQGRFVYGNCLKHPACCLFVSVVLPELGRFPDCHFLEAGQIFGAFPAKAAIPRAFSLSHAIP